MQRLGKIVLRGVGIVYTIFRLIFNQTDVRLVINQLKNDEYNLISACFSKISKISLCVEYMQRLGKGFLREGFAYVTAGPGRYKPRWNMSGGIIVLGALSETPGTIRNAQPMQNNKYKY